MQSRIAIDGYGEVAEWFNAAVLKTVEGASPPRVRISASPPIKEKRPFEVVFLFLNQCCLIRTLGGKSSTTSNRRDGGIAGFAFRQKLRLCNSGL